MGTVVKVLGSDVTVLTSTDSVRTFPIYKLRKRNPDVVITEIEKSEEVGDDG